MASEVAVLVDERNLAAAFTVAKVVDADAAEVDVGFSAAAFVAAKLLEAVGESSKGLLPAGAADAGGSSTADDGIVMVHSIDTVDLLCWRRRRKWREAAGRHCGENSAERRFGETGWHFGDAGNGGKNTWR